MGLWTRARELAAATSRSRNRYVDFLRALSISAVVFGHWLIAAPYVPGGEPELGHMLNIQPWTQWLTWGFQVMPIFFMVGGYSNAASWTATGRRGHDGYGDWLAARLGRLLVPLLPLLAFWVVLSILARVAGTSVEMVRIASQAALVPIWFLSVYMLVICCAPAAHAAWSRLGWGSFWALVAGAVAVDAVRFAGGWTAAGWVNYLLIWLAVHQLGFAWRDGRVGGPRSALPWAVLGLSVLLVLMFVGGYPRSMVGVPGEEVSNTLPPSLAMLALGMLQAGLLLSVEGPARRWLGRLTPWAATVLVNGMIMTVYLWHLTAMILLIGASLYAEGAGLRLAPGTAAWWSSRPLWMLALVVALAPLVIVFGRFERSAAPARTRVALRLGGGALAACVGLALLAFNGIDGESWLGYLPLVAVFGGAAIAGITPLAAPSQPASPRSPR